MGTKPLKALQDPQNEGRLYPVFKKYNKSKSGSLTKGEFQNVLNEMKKDGGVEKALLLLLPSQSCFNMTVLGESADNLFALADQDKDGSLSYLEFKEFLESALIGAKQQTAQTEKESAANVKVMIVGKPKAGKTSFVLSAMKETEALSSGILPRFDYRTKQLKFDGHRMNMNIYDPPNREYANLPGQVDKEFYQVFDEVSGMILAFDVTDKNAFKKPYWTESYLEEWKEKKGDAPVIMVACKCDTSHERMLFEEKIQEYADKFGLPWYETQAKTGVGIDEALEELARLMWPLTKKK